MALLALFGVLPATQAAPATAYVDVAVATLWAAPGTYRPVDEPAVGDPADIRGWTAGMTLAQRSDLVGRLETQALYGTAVRILERRNGWVRVAVTGQPTPRDPLGYPGWLPARQLTEGGAFGTPRRPFALVTARSAWLSADPAGTRHELELSADTRLPVLARTAAAVRVATPDRGDRWLAARDVRVHDRDIPRPTGADLVRTAKMFTGLPYLWAGTSSFGFDCSGFTHTVYHLHGITIPRDADAQRAGGRPVARDRLQPGDLIFYADGGGIHHVGMYLGDGYEIDAPANSATQESPLEIVQMDRHRYAAQYAGAVRYL
jgi:gamma-D-glutamyl-L-lysine dipeptidyl-peptidase